MENEEGIFTVTTRVVDSLPEAISQSSENWPGPYIQLSVSDTGDGIDQQLLEKIFDPFFTTKGKEKGTGMGLAVVYGIIHDIGGHITVESEPGAGSTFHVFLPQSSQPAEVSSEAHKSVPTGHEQILHVDDDIMPADIIKITLEGMGYKVTTKYNRSEALRLFQQNPKQFDIVLTDFYMPEMNGLTLTDHIRAIRPEPPIVLCTGFSAKVSEEVAMSRGISAFAYKPVTRNHMARIIR